MVVMLGFSPAQAVWEPPWQVGTSQKHVDHLALLDLEYYSPSALETFAMCPRKWAFSKLDKVEKESSAAADLGTAVHEQHERWFRDGTPYDLTTRAGELALATSDMLPPRDTFGLRVEQEIRFRHPAVPDVWFGGKIDLNWAETRDPSNGSPHAGWLRRIVTDHKSSSDVEQYGKHTREALLGHPQAPIYAMMFFVGEGEERITRPDSKREWIPWCVDPAEPDLDLRWNYVNTKGKPRGTSSWHTVTREEIEQAFETHVVPVALAMREAIRQANVYRASGETYGANRVSANTNACPAFGGCPFKNRCGVTPSQGIVTMADQSTGFLNRMGITPGAAPAGQPQGPPPGYGPQVAPPAQMYPGAPPAGVNGAGQPAYGGQPPHGAPPQGYGAQINPPENGTAAPGPGYGQPPPGPPPQEWRGGPPPAVAPAASPGPGRPPKDKSPPESFEARAFVAVLGGLARAWGPQLLTGAVPPSAVADCAAGIVKRATELGVK